MSYIPITIFITLLASLFLSLTLISPIFFKLNKNKKEFEENLDFQKYWLPENVELLKHDRKDKTELDHRKLSIRNKFLNNLVKRHQLFLKISLKNRITRILTFIVPVLILIFTIIVITPKLWFTMFEPSDEWIFTINIKGQEWTDTKYMESYLWWIESNLNNLDLPEIENYKIITNKNNIDITVDLLDQKSRKKQGLRNIWEIEKIITNKLSYIETYWLKLSSENKAKWPPSGGNIWISLIASSNQNFEKLITISKDFEEFLKNRNGTKNISNSSKESPWQFIFNFDNEKLRYLWLTPNNIMWELYMKLNGTKAWSLKWKYEDSEIRIKIKDFDETLSPEDILQLSINTKSWSVKLSEILKYNFQTAVSSISREDGKILVKIESDVEKWIDPIIINTELTVFANEYNFPEWIYWEKWWEVEENAELVTSIITSFIIAIILIFMVLVLQFNSYVQPIIILSSILFSVIWMNIWLLITWHMYSISAVIWFIALTGIVVNDAIILIDRINNNRNRWMNWKEAIIESAKSRLHPIIVTTLTTAFGVLPISLTDIFFGWLWYTLMFGLLIWSLATLTVIPAFYYMLFVKEE
jgi:HAE1 family hydrophobic/amphiphilic exporter-1